MSASKKSWLKFGVAAAVIVLAIVAVVVGLVVGLAASDLSDGGAAWQIPCVLPDGTEESASSAKCTAAGCEWVERAAADPAPRCIWRNLSRVYSLDQNSVVVQKKSREATMTVSGNPTLLGQDYVKEVGLLVSCMGTNQLRIKYFDRASKRFEVPPAAVNIGNTSVDCTNTSYDVRMDSSPYPGVTVIRRSTKAVIFSTSTPAFAFTDQFIQLTVALNSGLVYGFGEHNHEQFKHDMNYKRWTVFTRDAAPVSKGNLYGAQMLYMNIEKSLQANGVFLLNSNGLEILMQPEPYPAITYRAIGGLLDFYLFLGPTPEEVVQQYTGAVGRMVMPPYWGLGFMLSRWGYNNTDHIRTVVKRNSEADIPLDVVFGDIDYMQNYLSFTYNNDTFKDFPDYVDSVLSQGIKFITILDPGIGIQLNNTALSLGVAQDVFIKNPNGSRFVGEVWPGKVYYPDFTDNRTDAWWLQMLQHLYNGTWAAGKVGLKYEGLWVDMNEPSNFIDNVTDACLQNKWNSPPYIPPTLIGPYIYSKTLCMDSVQSWGKHYDVHNLYGHSMSMSTYKALKSMFPNERPFVLTRSNFAGTGQYATHWLGDNQSRWPQMKLSIVGMLEYSLFGFGHGGADICGFWFEAEYELCLRWTQLGAFYPFSRNHNGKGDFQEYFKDQDPAAFDEPFVAAARSILHTRYRLLPYLYTLFFHGHTDGSTVARPLLHEFVADSVTHGIDEQFLWGPALLISPVLRQGQNQVRAYFPNARWFDYFTREEILEPGSWNTLNTPLNKTNLHVRGGYVIPHQDSANNTQYSRRNPFGLLVALDPSGAAKGDLFYDDGESAGTIENKQYLHLQFDVKAQNLTVGVSTSGYAEVCTRNITSIVVLGIRERATWMAVDGQEITSFNSTIAGSRKDVDIAVQLPVCNPHVVAWR